MVTSVITLLGSLLPSSASHDAKLVREELSKNAAAAAKINARLPEDDINEGGAKINEVIVSAAVEHDKDFASVTEEDDIENETNDAETETGNSAYDDTDSGLVRGMFFEIFGCLPIFFVIYWPLFLFLITKICKVAKIAQISPRVAQPM